MWHNHNGKGAWHNNQWKRGCGTTITMERGVAQQSQWTRGRGTITWKGGMAQQSMEKGVWHNNHNGLGGVAQSQWTRGCGTITMERGCGTSQSVTLNQITQKCKH